MCTVGNPSCYGLVDIFDGNTGTWHTAQMSAATGDGYSVTSLPSHGLALFGQMADGGGALLRK